MVIFLMDQNAVTLTLHKADCLNIPPVHPNGCGCGAVINAAHQHCFCEEHFHTEAIIKFMDGRYWPVLLCETCYGR